MKENNWLLPEGIEEILPEQAFQLECIRRKMIDLMQSWGYELVIPPLIEYIDSLLTGTGHDLDLKTFKLIDQLSGRQMGVRADITPQVARIDAHHYNQDIPSRLCYIGTVLHTVSDAFSSSRSPLQMGAELYGHGGVESDVEIICLMIDIIKLAGIQELYIDIGHVAIFESVVKYVGLDRHSQQQFIDILQRKSKPDLIQLLNYWQLPSEKSELLSALMELSGDQAVLEKARKILVNISEQVGVALDYIEQLAKKLSIRNSEIPLFFDFTELSGFHYHTGIVFAAYTPGAGQEIARGGRYDGIGEVFGRGRCATGFSTDLKNLILLQKLNEPWVKSKILAPCVDDHALHQLVQTLRNNNECVIFQLSGQQGNIVDLKCDQQIVKISGQWSVVKMKESL